MTSVLGLLIVGLIDYNFEDPCHRPRALTEQWQSLHSSARLITRSPFSLTRFGKLNYGFLCSIIIATTPIMIALVAHQLTSRRGYQSIKYWELALGSVVSSCYLVQLVMGGWGIFVNDHWSTATFCYAFTWYTPSG